MTEKTYFWAGASAPPGDSIYSPYNAEEFNLFHFMPLLGGKNEDAFVVPDYLGNLEVKVTTDGSHSVSVSAGAAVFNNHFYILDETLTLPIDRVTANNYRRDLVVLRLTTNTNKIRAEIVKGGATTTYPVEPTPTQTGAIWEVVLAVVFVSGNETILYNHSIWDRRKFIYTYYIRQKYGWQENLIVNSEWLAASESQVAGLADPPDAWDFIYDGVASFITSGTGREPLAKGSSRGNLGLYLMNANLAAYAGIAQWITAGASKTYTVHGYLEDIYGLADKGFIIGLRAYLEDGTESASFKEIKFMRYNNELAEYQFTVTFPEDNIKTLFLYFISEGGVSDGTASVGQPTLVAGYFPGGFFPQTNEAILFRAPITRYTGANSSFAATCDIAAFPADPGYIRRYTKAIILRLQGRDSGSAAGNPSIQIRGYAAPFNAVYGTLRLQGVPNDEWRETQMIVPVDQIYWGTGVAGAQFRIDCVATGAATLDLNIQIVGIIT